MSVAAYDIKSWDDTTTVLDLNAEEVSFPQADLFVFSGVLEYLNSIENTLCQAMRHCRYMLVSYAFLPADAAQNDIAFLELVHSRSTRNGWRNHFSSVELIGILTRLGVISGVDVWEGRQALVLFRNFEIDMCEIVEAQGSRS